MLLEFLKGLGVRFDMDWDEEVTLTVPETVSSDEISHALQPFKERLCDEVRSRAKRQRTVFVGGSLNGQMIGAWQCLVPTIHPDGTTHHWIVHHVARGRWEIYDQECYMGRAFFRGTRRTRGKRNAARLVNTSLGGNHDHPRTHRRRR